ncbi:alpha/beta fold hydrolase [Streptomyces sp. NPDC002004]
MSRPPTFVPPPGARAHALATSRGTFAVIDADATTTPRGTVLLLPGFTGSKEDFIALHEPLAAAGYRTVAVDGRGQYESDGPKDDEAPYGREELARDVLAQAAALGATAERPVHLVGHSLGGLIARAAVLLDPAPFRSLTLMSSGPARISPSQRKRVEMLQEALGAMDMTHVWDAMRALEPLEETHLNGRDDAEDLRRRWLRTSPAQLSATIRLLCTEPDRVDELSTVRMPKHVVSGDHDDAWPVPLLDRMAVRLGAHRTVVEGADHSPNTDRPERTAEALAAFWAELG